jgi:hypothetical protein
MHTKMTSFRKQATWAKMMSPGGKLIALVSHLTKKVSKAEELTYVSVNIAYYLLQYVYGGAGVPE